MEPEPITEDNKCFYRNCHHLKTQDECDPRLKMTLLTSLYGEFELKQPKSQEKKLYVVHGNSPQEIQKKKERFYLRNGLIKIRNRKHIMVLIFQFAFKSEEHTIHFEEDNMPIYYARLYGGISGDNAPHIFKMYLCACHKKLFPLILNACDIIRRRIHYWLYDKKKNCIDFTPEAEWVTESKNWEQEVKQEIHELNILLDSGLFGFQEDWQEFEGSVTDIMRYPTFHYLYGAVRYTYEFLKCIYRREALNFDLDAVL